LTVRQAQDLPGRWAAHVLELDVVMYGETLFDALAKGIEAAREVVDGDLAQGSDPFERRAPKAFFDELGELLEGGFGARGGGAAVPWITAQLEV
jgi:hypothetical protein